MLQTEYEFTLPRGYIDEQGNLHRDGTMRLAKARDEIEPLDDERVQRNRAYVGVLLLARVVTRLGSLRTISPTVIENLFTSDYTYLQDLFITINDPTNADIVETECPHCGTRFTLDLSAGSFDHVG